MAAVLVQLLMLHIFFKSSVFLLEVSWLLLPGRGHLSPQLSCLLLQEHLMVHLSCLLLV